MHGLPGSDSSDQSRGNEEKAENSTAVSLPTTSPGTVHTSSGDNGKKRNSSAAGFITSPDSPEDGIEEADDRRRLPGVKRACNECRQQKLRCDVIQDPQYIPCARCQRLGLDCKIDANFRRVGKRHKNAEMEKELSELRAQLSRSQQASPTATHYPLKTSASMSASPTVPNVPMSSIDQYIDSQEAVASLLDLKSGIEGGSNLRTSNGATMPVRRLEGVILSYDRIQQLFYNFFTFNHPFLPFLESDRAPNEHYEASPLLFWVIIAVAARRDPVDPTLLGLLAGPLSRLLWATLQSVPQSYLVVKALCIICTWPMPISSTSVDPTFMLSGTMMQIAMQIGIHRPSHAQDFTKFKVELREEELRDRVRTWATCNAVAQRVATGYGLPTTTYYDWTLNPHGPSDSSYKLPEEAEARLLIEQYCNRVTQLMYRKDSDPVGLPGNAERLLLMNVLANELQQLEAKLKAHILPTSVTSLYLRAAELHLRLSTFFESPNSKDYHVNLTKLWMSTTSFLETASSTDLSGGIQIQHATNYILQMIIAAGFSLLKLLNSFFADRVDLEYGKKLFRRAIWMIRTISVSHNDLPSRLAEVLAQLWSSGGAGSRVSNRSNEVSDSSLQLKVRCRMSMSLVYDSVWRWREEFQAKGKGNLEAAVSNPTNLDSAAESSTSSAIVDPSFAPPAFLGNVAGADYGDSSTYEVFDPLSWTLDGLLDFPFGNFEATD